MFNWWYCVNIAYYNYSHAQWLKTMNVYYLTISVGQKSTRCFFCLKISHKIESHSQSGMQSF